MKTKLIALSLLLASRLLGTTIDLGPNGSTYYRTYDFNDLNGITFNGQTISIDLTFSTQVHLFANTYPNFLISVAFLTNGGESFITGTGYVTDINGNPMIGTGSILGSANTTNLMWVGLFPIYYGLERPADIYGAHFDLTLPDLNGSVITAGGIELFDSDFILNGHRVAPFRIGPHIPESGGTVFLLLIGLAPLIAIRKCA